MPKVRIFKHSVCKLLFVGPENGDATECPMDVIPKCPNPTLGFVKLGGNVFQCKSCKYVFEAPTAPTTCPSINAKKCPDTTGGEFKLVGEF